MMAMWNDAVLAETDETIVGEGNHHFPPDYHDVVAGDQVNEGAAGASVTRRSPDWARRRPSRSPWWRRLLPAPSISLTRVAARGSRPRRQ